MAALECSEFLARFSEFHDELPEAAERGLLHEHHETCPSCRRYARVVDQGVKILKDLPRPEPSEGFRSTLNHRIRPLSIASSSGAHLPHPSIGSQMTSGANMGAVAAIAVVLCVIAWSPTLLPASSEVELPAVVVSAPPGSLASPDARATGLFASPASFPLAPSPEGLWGRPHLLLYEYSPLSGQNRRPRLVRAALDR
jgi:hypothetical protein